MIFELKLFICAFFAYFFYYFSVLDKNGSFFAGLMGLIIWEIQGLNWVLLMIGFVFISTCATRYKYAVKKKLLVAENSGGVRRSKNVIANGIVPLLISITGKIYGWDVSLYFVGAVAAATGDTLSSEIGVLSRGKTYLITTLKETEKGVDGGVSALGFASAMFGGFLIGLLAIFVSISYTEPYLLVVIGVISSLFGSIVDSILGATLERYGFITNEIVNFFCTISGAYVVSFVV